MSRPHDTWVEEQERNYMRLRIGGPPTIPLPPDDMSDDHGACLLTIRRLGWSGRVEAWMIQWVRDARASVTS
jgi:hypothetical protein